MSIQGWKGFGPSATFFFGGALALIAALAMGLWKPKPADGGRLAA